MGIGFRNDLEGPRPLGHSLWPFLLEADRAGPFDGEQRSALQQALPRVLHESWSRCPLEELEMFLRPLVVPSAVPCSAAQARSRAESAAMQSRAGLCRLFLFMGLALQAPNLVCSC